MSIVPSFDRTKFYLGVLCKYGHDFEGTKKSLRYKSSRNCFVCTGVKRPGAWATGSSEQRFWNYVNRESGDGCWNWKGTISPRKYGSLDVAGKAVRAHRLSYELHYGEIPDGFDILHSCDNPQCVNPKHLRAGTHTDNMQDKIQRGRANCVKGSLNRASKLNDDIVKEIRALYASGNTSHRKLAARYGVSRSTIASLLNRKNWKHVP